MEQWTEEKAIQSPLQLIQQADSVCSRNQYTIACLGKVKSDVTDHKKGLQLRT